MYSPSPPAYDVIAHAEDAPIVLVGQPGTLIGELPLHNPGSETLVLRDLRVRAEQLPAEGKARGEETIPLLVSQSVPVVVLHPGQGRRVPLTIHVPAHTPPGEYRCQ